MRGIGRRFVYVLRSEPEPTHHYVGVTADVDERLDWHNGGPSGYTVNYRPWRVIVSMEFRDERPARIRLKPYRGPPSFSSICHSVERVAPNDGLTGA